MPSQHQSDRLSSQSRIKDLVMSGKALDYNDAYSIMDAIMSGQTAPAQIAALLTALNCRGFDAAVVHGCADAMRDHALPLAVDARGAVDIVGTGGDGAGTVNISTMAAVTLAAAGIPVIKHGNRASTSLCGSADVLDALGVKLTADPGETARIFNDAGITFCFAMTFHPAMRFAGPIRKELGFPTIFNLLGPLTNPGRPAASAIGVANLRALELVSETLSARGDTGLVFTSKHRGLDELAAFEPQIIVEVRDGKIERHELDLVDLGLDPITLDQLQGGDASANAQVARAVFAGEDGVVAQTVAINAAAGLVAADPLSDGPLPERLIRAYSEIQQVLASGQAAQKLHDWIAAAH